MGYTKDKDGNWLLSDSYVSSGEEVITECVNTKEVKETRIEFEKNWELNREDRYKDYLDTMIENTVTEITVYTCPSDVASEKITTKIPIE